MVLLMTVNPGFGGQRFIDTVRPQGAGAARRDRRRGLDVDIEVDGGIAAATSPTVIEAGANVLVAGSAIFGAPGHDYAGAIGALRAAAPHAK